ncbi:MAG: beta-ketoacyl-ACP synthase III [Bryobacteraceae bacterium]
MRKAKITAVGCFTPPGVLTNQDLTHMVETSDQWILERTGIRSRHIAPPEMATSDMAVEAAKIALENRGIDASGLDAILLCTVTPDMFFPSTACLVQNKLGSKKAWGFDLIAACSGFVYGLTTAAHLIGCGTHKQVLVIGSDTMSRIIDYTDRSTCVLFGDGAGAMLVEPSEDGEEVGFLGFSNEIDGSGGDYLKMPAGGSRMPATVETVQNRMHYVHQEGQQVFKYAVRKMYELCSELLERNNLTLADVDWLIPHQANKRIIDAVSEKMGLSDRVIINIEEFGNTTAATIPLATRTALESGRLKKGDLVLFAAVGAGYTAGANLWRWGF